MGALVDRSGLDVCWSLGFGSELGFALEVGGWFGDWFEAVALKDAAAA